MIGKSIHIDPSSANGKADDWLWQLISDCRRNDRRAQRKLYDMYSAFVFGIIRRYTGDNVLAQEIHSEAFCRIFARLDQYRFEGAFEGWMRKITVHSAADYFLQNRPKDAVLPEDAEDFAVFHDSDALSKLAYRELLAMIHALPPTQRAVFNLFVFEQYSHKDIASALEITENNSRWHLNDARRRLKEKITAIHR